MHIHICITTGQALANLIPILQEQPDKVVLITTPVMQTEATKFINTLKAAGFNPETIVEKSLDDQDYETTLNNVFEIYDQLTNEFSSASFTYNATGGTKPITLAFYDIFRDHHRIIYTDTNNNHIAVLAPTDTKNKLIPMASVLNLGVSLKALGKTLRSTTDSADWLRSIESRKPLTKLLAKLTKSNPKLFGLINGLVKQSRDSNLKKPVPIAKVFKQLDELLSLAHEHSLIDYYFDENEHEIILHSELAADYLQGGWLEEYVYLTARDIGFEEVYCSVKMTDDSKSKADIRNEMDVVISHKNRLLFIECKTSRMDKEADIIYKLDALGTQAGGILSSKLLVSAQPLTYVNKDGKTVNALARAQSYKIKTCSEGEVLKLRELLLQWKEDLTWAS